VAESAAALVLALLLVSAVHFISVLGMPLGLFAPVPLAILCLRRGVGALAACAVLGMAALGALEQGPGAASFLFAVALPAFVVARGLTRAWTPEVVVGAVAVPLTVATLVALQLTLPDGIRAWVGQMVDQLIDTYAKQGGPASMVEGLKAQAPNLADFAFHMMPATVAFSGILLGAASLLAARAYLARRAVPGALPFDPLAWHLPDPWIWALIAAGVLLLIPHPAAHVVGGNALGVIAVCYAFQGWAVVACIFKAKQVHGAIRAAFYALLVLWPVLTLFLVLAGVFDTWTDLRRVRPRPEPGPE
jgi:uncharacterized protein YybS (DUF2232 family)